MNVRKLGIVAAMPEEFSLLVSRFSATHAETIGPRDFFRAHVGSRELVFVCSRIGKVAASSTATTLIQSFGVDAVLLTGVAGGVASGIGVGDVVVADALVQHDIDLRGVLGCNRLDIPLLGTAAIATCPELTHVAIDAAGSMVRHAEYTSAVRALAHREPKFHVGTIASGDVFVNSERERTELLSLISGLRCVEMEGAAVAQVCAEQSVPFAVARVISDSANSDASVDFSTFLAQAAAVGSERFVMEFISRL